MCVCVCVCVCMRVCVCVCAQKVHILEGRTHELSAQAALSTEAAVALQVRRMPVDMYQPSVLS